MGAFLSASAQISQTNGWSSTTYGGFEESFQELWDAYHSNPNDPQQEDDYNSINDKFRMSYFFKYKQKIQSETANANGDAAKMGILIDFIQNSGDLYLAAEGQANSHYLLKPLYGEITYGGTTQTIPITPIQGWSLSPIWGNPGSLTSNNASDPITLPGSPGSGTNFQYRIYFQKLEFQ